MILKIILKRFPLLPTSFCLVSYPFTQAEILDFARVSRTLPQGILRSLCGSLCSVITGYQVLFPWWYWPPVLFVFSIPLRLLKGFHHNLLFSISALLWIGKHVKVLGEKVARKICLTLLFLFYLSSWLHKHWLRFLFVCLFVFLNLVTSWRRVGLIKLSLSCIREVPFILFWMH